MILQKLEKSMLLLWEEKEAWEIHDLKVRQIEHPKHILKELPVKNLQFGSN